MINKILRILTFLLATFFLYLGFRPLFNIVQELITQKQIITQTNLTLLLLLIFVGLYLFAIAKNWNSKTKETGKFLIGWGIFFILFGIIYIAVDKQVETIDKTVQDSIDFLVVNSAEGIIANQFEQNFQNQVNLQITTNNSLKTYYIQNLTPTQAEELLTKTNITISPENRLKFVKIIISEIHNNMKTKNPELTNMPIPISLLSEQIKNNAEVLNQINKLNTEENILDSYTINPEAKISILYSENVENINKKIIELTPEEYAKIWESMGLKTDLSQNTKENIIKIILCQLEPTQISVPISSISYMIPQEYQTILEHDILNPNQETRLEEFQELKQEYYASPPKTIENDTFKEFIEQTEYNNLLAKINENNTIPQPIYSKINTTENLKKMIDEKTSQGPKYLILGTIFSILGLVALYLNYKYIEQGKNIVKEISLEVIKLTIAELISLIVVFALTLLLFLPENLARIIPEQVLSQLPFEVSTIPKIPIIKIMLDLIKKCIILSVIGTIVLSISYFIIKKFYGNKTAPETPEIKT